MGQCINIKKQHPLERNDVNPHTSPHSWPSARNVLQIAWPSGDPEPSRWSGRLQCSHTHNLHHARRKESRLGRECGTKQSSGHPPPRNRHPPRRFRRICHEWCPRQLVCKETNIWLYSQNTGQKTIAKFIDVSVQSEQHTSSLLVRRTNIKFQPIINSSGELMSSRVEPTWNKIQETLKRHQTKWLKWLLKKSYMYAR